MKRVILCMDLDAFFCSVEIILNPALEALPFVVGGSPDGRGVVTSASYKARAYGIRSAMPTAQAVRLYPELVIVRSSHGIYSKYSRTVMEILRDSAPLIEQASIDEAYLDVSDARESGLQIATAIRDRILKETALPTSWGVAVNKMVAKIATGVGKPDGMVVVPAGAEAAFLAPLPVQMLSGVGPKTCERLHEFAIHTIGDLAALNPQRLTDIFGDRGPHLARQAQGIDDRPLVTGQARRSMSVERTFSADISDTHQLERVMLKMSEEIGSRLRKEKIAGNTVRVKLRWPDFSTITRQKILPQPTDVDREIYEAACQLFLKAHKSGKAVRLLGVGVAGLGHPVRQLELFDTTWERDEDLLNAIDQIRDRFGPNALRRAAQLKMKKE